MNFFCKWMSKNYASFEKLDKIYESLTPKHIQVKFLDFLKFFFAKDIFFLSRFAQNFKKIY